MERHRFADLQRSLQHTECNVRVRKTDPPPEWDVRSVLEPNYHLSDGSIGALIDTVPRAVRRAFRPEPDLESPIRYRFSVSSPVSTSVDIVATRELISQQSGSELDGLTPNLRAMSYTGRWRAASNTCGTTSGPARVLPTWQT